VGVGLAAAAAGVAHSCASSTCLRVSCSSPTT
jgi:hypothetical protein